MIGTSGWDTLMLSVRTTPDGVELRVGAFFLPVLALAIYKLVGWFEEEVKEITS